MRKLFNVLLLAAVVNNCQIKIFRVKNSTLYRSRGITWRNLIVLYKRHVRVPLAAGLYLSPFTILLVCVFYSFFFSRQSDEARPNNEVPYKNCLITPHSLEMGVHSNYVDNISLHTGTLHNPGKGYPAKGSHYSTSVGFVHMSRFFI